jgi:hypothetical protein
MSAKQAIPFAAARRCPLHPWATLAMALAAALLAPAAAAAQPFAAYTAWSGDGVTAAANGWLAVPDGPGLDPGSAITLEGWFDLATPFGEPQNGCRSLIGKDLTRGYWLGVCGGILESSFNGGPPLAAGTVAAGQWTHLAVTWDGAVQSNYVNGELAGTTPASGALTASPAELRIGSDVSWPWSPSGAAAEVRLWSVARTIDQIRSTINLPLTTPQPGLVAVWSLAGAADSLGVSDGAWNGAVTPVALASAPPCTASTATALCLAARLAVTVAWRDASGATGAGAVAAAPSATSSGLFWFFAADNWELMVKTVDGCALNGALWLFSAATTNVFYRLEVQDLPTGITKIYFNYPGPPAPAVTDTTAFPGSC